MELWIRSQDKTMLCKPQYIELQGADEIAMGDINIGYRCVATYKSKERALEVLDEIQEILEPKFILHTEEIKKPITEFMYTVEKIGDIKELSTYVYEMPKE